MGLNNPERAAQVAIGDIVDVKRGSMSDKSGTVKFIKANNLLDRKSVV